MGAIIDILKETIKTFDGIIVIVKQICQFSKTSSTIIFQLILIMIY